MAIDYIPKGWEVTPSSKVKTYLGNEKWNNPKMPAQENGGGQGMNKGMSDKPPRYDKVDK